MTLKYEKSLIYKIKGGINLYDDNDKILLEVTNSENEKCIENDIPGGINTSKWDKWFN